jgi:hypothetical protein
MGTVQSDDIPCLVIGRPQVRIRPGYEPPAVRKSVNWLAVAPSGASISRYRGSQLTAAGSR